MPIIKIHRKISNKENQGGVERKILNLAKDFFNLPENYILIFSLNDLTSTDQRKFVLEIEMKKRTDTEIEKFIELMQNELPEIDAISIKMFENKNVLFKQLRNKIDSINL